MKKGVRNGCRWFYRKDKPDSYIAPSYMAPSSLLFATLMQLRNFNTSQLTSHDVQQEIVPKSHIPEGIYQLNRTFSGVSKRHVRSCVGNDWVGVLTAGFVSAVPKMDTSVQLVLKPNSSAE
jgi:hypothetical protein